MLIVQMMIGSDCLPVSRITLKFIPNPSSITAHCRTFLEAKAMPSFNFALSFMNKVTVIPIRIPKIGPPITGNSFPKNHDGNAISRQTTMPGKPFFTKSINTSLKKLSQFFPAFIFFFQLDGNFLIFFADFSNF